MRSNLVIVYCVLFLTACIDGPSNQLKHDPNYIHAYVCPITCEKGKTYEQPGKCLVCHRKLLQKEVKVKNLNPGVDSTKKK